MISSALAHITEGIILGLAIARLLPARKAVATREPGSFFAIPDLASFPGKTSGDYTVKILKNGPNKIQDIKAIRLCTRAGLKDAKDIEDNVPSLLAVGIAPEQADHFRAQLEATGMSVLITFTDDSLLASSPQIC